MLLCGELTCIRWGARVRINVQTDCHTRTGRQTDRQAVPCCASFSDVRSFVRSFVAVRRSPFVLRSTPDWPPTDLHDPIGGGRGAVRAAHFMMMIIDDDH